MVLNLHFLRCPRAKEFHFGTAIPSFVTSLTHERDGGHSLLTSLSLISGQVDVDRLLLEGFEESRCHRAVISKFLKTADGIRAMVAFRFGTGPNETSSGSLPLTPRLLPLNNRKHRQLRRHQPQRQRILPNTLARRPARRVMRTFILAGRKVRTGSRRTRKGGSPSTAVKIATAPRRVT